jgi:hypothetical protein
LNASPSLRHAAPAVTEMAAERLPVGVSDDMPAGYLVDAPGCGEATWWGGRSFGRDAHRGFGGSALSARGLHKASSILKPFPLGEGLEGVLRDDPSRRH